MLLLMTGCSPLNRGALFPGSCL